jgi:hypothetical protein
MISFFDPFGGFLGEFVSVVSVDGDSLFVVRGVLLSTSGGLLQISSDLGTVYVEQTCVKSCERVFIK